MGNDRHYCKLCGVYIPNHPRVIQDHEAAKQHKEKVAEMLEAAKRRVPERRDTSGAPLAKRVVPVCDESSSSDEEEDVVPGSSSANPLLGGWVAVASHTAPHDSTDSEESCAATSDDERLSPETADVASESIQEAVDVPAAAPPNDTPTGVGSGLEAEEVEVPRRKRRIALPRAD